MAQYIAAYLYKRLYLMKLKYFKATHPILYLITILILLLKRILYHFVDIELHLQ